MVRIGDMANRARWTNRRELMAGLGAAILAPALPAAPAFGAQARALQAKADVLALGLGGPGPGGPETPIWSLGGPDIRFRRGDRQEIAFGNDLPIPVVLDWRGIDGASATEPLLAKVAVAPGGTDSFQFSLRHAGTFLCDLALLGDGAARPSRGLPLVVAESDPVAVDRDEVLLIEDWRLRADGSAIAPGIDPKDARPVYTLNGLAMLDITARAHERLRLRFINGCQRTVVAVKVWGTGGAGHGPRRAAGRAVSGAQWRARAGAGKPG
jgi:FtsP/CotA-like multicopper oxidase with cupredoxin domain